MAGPTPPTGWRRFLPDLTIPRFATMAQQDAHVYAADFKQNGRPPWLYALYQHWLQLLAEPFKGVTSDGTVRPNLFTLQDEGIPITTIVERTTHLLSLLSPEERTRVLYHIDSPEWRTWSNPEFLLAHKGIRLDEVKDEVRDAAMGVLQATLSQEGYAKAVSAMRINGFLGQLVESPRVCNEFSYNMCIFGSPSTTAPWGLSFYGHHLCLNVFFYRTQMVVSPWFVGAEPNEIDEGQYKGTKILRREEALGLKLMQSLSPEVQEKVRVYEQMKDPEMPPGRWNRDDQRHLCGAYRDNRVVPYEGVVVAELPKEAQELVLGILEEYFLFLPERARKVRLEQAKQHFKETYFCWIGGFEGQDAVFYYRIQSPVVIVEFDHHSGVFLTNEQPERFHTHTLLRTPNGGDYGMALRALIPGEVDQAWVWDEDKK